MNVNIEEQKEQSDQLELALEQDLSEAVGATSLVGAHVSQIANRHNPYDTRGETMRIGSSSDFISIIKADESDKSDEPRSFVVQKASVTYSIQSSKAGDYRDGVTVTRRSEKGRILSTNVYKNPDTARKFGALVSRQMTKRARATQNKNAA